MKGLSLVEALVTTLIFTLLFAALFMLLSSGQAAWYTADVQIQLNSEIRKCLLTMDKELRQTRPAQINIPDDGNTYTIAIFSIPDCLVPGPGCSVINGLGQITWSSNITYSLNGSQIIRNKDGANTILANNIISLQFTRAPGDPNIIVIDITARGNTVWNRVLQASITSSVRMRN